MGENNKNTNVQILRGWAILLVMFMHIPLILSQPMADYYCTHLLKFIHPATGVDLFFAISGYLMGKTFLQKTETTSISILENTLKFYRKRFLRLIPGAYFWALATLLMGLLFHDASIWLDSQSLINKFFCSLSFIRNFEESIKPTHLGYYWSLSLEAQFYLLLPLAWFSLKRKPFWLLISGLFLLGFFWRPGAANWWLFRYDGLLIGLLLWRITQQESWREFAQLIIPKDKWLILVTVLLSLCTICVLPIAIGNIPTVYSGVVALICGYIMMIAVFQNESIMISSAFSTSLEFIGEMSYSIYLSHIPVWLLVKEIINKLSLNLPLPVYLVLALSSSLLAGWLSYKYVERVSILKKQSPIGA
ncbi:MAG: putative acyltransferase [Firmicutes bacterium]|nr:putative acyltransferase [Bacillota bacterium]